MSIWDKQGNAHCHCGATRSAGVTREATLQVLRALGWHHSAGKTQGGSDYEALLCPSCARDERKRRVVKPGIDQDALPISWDDYRTEATGEQQHQR